MLVVYSINKDQHNIFALLIHLSLQNNMLFKNMMQFYDFVNYIYAETFEYSYMVILCKFA